ncbi:MAG: hypothetical protein OJF49_003227 [Ktedonobacterales bacterium]|jgi:hypothetical protein|nr:MAG: hypothetical protein OJF49_003227 [Ktedonobacterales bacterium]
MAIKGKKAACKATGHQWNPACADAYEICLRCGAARRMNLYLWTDLPDDPPPPLFADFDPEAEANELREAMRGSTVLADLSAYARDKRTRRKRA